MTKHGIVIALMLTGVLVAWGIAHQANLRGNYVAYNYEFHLEDDSEKSADSEESTDEGQKKVEVATFGAGCFWCVEAVFQRLKGVSKIEPGYCNGATLNPTYREVCSGTTGHAEVCRIEFDPAVISFTELLEVFWKTHDPTTLNRQGADVGTQYRSAIFL